MKPILFPATSTSWTSNGLGALSDAVSCVVVEERNGEYELTMQYPVGGIHFDEIHDRAIIYAIPSPYRTPQPFRIYSIESPLNGIVTIHAHHISYDLSGIPVEPFTAASCSQALTGLTAHSVVTNPFSVSTDKNVSATYTLKVPTSFRACLGGQEGSILDVYGKGEYEFDKYSVKLWVNRGNDNGVKIAYGKNLTDFNMERNLESVTTGIYPYWSDFEGTELVEVNGRIIKIYDPLNPTYLLESGGAYLTEAEDKYLTVQTPFNFTNIVPVDFSGDFEEKPTPEELYARAEKYILDNSLGVPRVSIDVSFIDLGQTEEYKDLAVLEACDLCDTVTVEFPMYGISVKSKIIRIETDVLLERYNSVEIGDSRPTIADTIATLTTTSATKTEVKNGNAIAADVINNTKGVFEWIDNDEDGENEGFTIYESDGVAFLRCTAGGIGLSQDGGFTYTNAITKYGVIATQLDVEDGGYTVLSAGLDEDNNNYPYLAMYKENNQIMYMGVKTSSTTFTLSSWQNGNPFLNILSGPALNAVHIYNTENNNIAASLQTTSNGASLTLYDSSNNTPVFTSNVYTSSDASQSQSYLVLRNRLIGHVFAVEYDNIPSSHNGQVVLQCGHFSTLSNGGSIQMNFSPTSAVLSTHIGSTAKGFAVNSSTSSATTVSVDGISLSLEQVNIGGRNRYILIGA